MVSNQLPNIAAAAHSQRQNALYASSPSHPAIIMPTTQAPAPVTSIPDHVKESEVNDKASPIELASATMLAYDGASSTANQPQAQVQGNFADPSLAFGPESGVDLTSIGMNELSAMMNQQTELFSSASNPTDTTQPQDLNLFNESTGPSTTVTPGTQAETEKLIASISQAPAEQPTNAEEPKTDSNADQTQGDVNSLFASLQPTTQQEVPSTQTAETTAQNFNFDFGTAEGGDVDLSELAGLFSDAEVQAGAAALGGDGAAEQPTSVAPPTAGAEQNVQQSTQAEQQQAAPETQVPQPDFQMQTAQVSQPDFQIQSDPTIQNDGQSNAGGEGIQGDIGDLGAINFDEFNFGDSDMPNVEGDEFESLFAEFK